MSMQQFDISLSAAQIALVQSTIKYTLQHSSFLESNEAKELDFLENMFDIRRLEAQPAVNDFCEGCEIGQDYYWLA